MASTSAGTVSVNLEAKTTKFYQDMTQASKKFQTSLNQMTSHAKAFRNTMNTLFTGYLAANAISGMKRAFTGISSVITGFEKSMSSVKAITGATTEEMGRLTAEARRLGSETEFSASDVAEGMTLLGQAGFNTEQIIGAVSGTLALASAGGLELAEAAETASGILNAFSLQAEEAGRVSDILAMAANASNADVRGMGFAMKYAGAIANSLGLSLEETSAAIMALSNSNLKGETAGTGLRNVLVTLTKPSKELKEILGDTSIETDSLVTVLKKLQNAHLETGEMMKYFGDVGGNVALILAKNADSVDQFKNALDNSLGSAQKMRNEMQNNISGATKTMWSKFDELILKIGDAGFAGSLKQAYEQLARLLDDLIDSGRAEQFGGILTQTFNTIASSVGWLSESLIDLSIGLNEFFGKLSNYSVSVLQGGTMQEIKEFYKQLESMRQGEESTDYGRGLSAPGRKYQGPKQEVDITVVGGKADRWLEDMAARAQQYKNSYQIARQEFLKTTLEISMLTGTLDANGEALLDTQTAALALAAAENKLQNSMRETRLASSDWRDGLKQSLADIQRDAQDVAKNFYNAFNTTFNDLGDTLSDFFTTGKLGLKELEQSILQTFNRLMVQQLIIGPMAGMMNNWLGTNLLAGRAIGGLATAGNAYLVGEHGPELFTPAVSGTVHNAFDTQRMVQGAMNQVSVSQTINVQTNDVNGFNHSADQLLARMNAAQRRLFRRRGGV